jgi:hypothetical protein
LKLSTTDVCSDEAEIKKLHFKYGYYLDKCLYQEVKFQVSLKLDLINSVRLPISLLMIRIPSLSSLEAATEAKKVSEDYTSEDSQAIL